jgi:hypothetical protein
VTDADIPKGSDTSRPKYNSALRQSNVESTMQLVSSYLRGVADTGLRRWTNGKGDTDAGLCAQNLEAACNPLILCLSRFFMSRLQWLPTRRDTSELNIGHLERKLVEVSLLKD